MTAARDVALEVGIVGSGAVKERDVRVAKCGRSGSGQVLPSYNGGLIKCKKRVRLGLTSQ